MDLAHSSCCVLGVPALRESQSLERGQDDNRGIHQERVGEKTTS
jgi:hypothetical protein